MSKIEIHNLYKIFGPQPQNVLPAVREGLGKEDVLERTGHTVGLENISLEIEAGETFVVMGLSGSGKSTLIRCINRLIEPTAGSVRIDKTDILDLSKREVQSLRRAKIGMVFQRFALLPHRNILDNVAYGLKIQGVPRTERHERAREWISTVGLAGYEEARPRALSGGMQQRVGLARALCTDPEILLMDEPFSALDPLIRREMQDELIRLQQELHKTIVFITHDLDEALRLGDRVAILKHGRLVQVGTPQDILMRPADDYVEAFIQDVNRSRILTAEGAMESPVRAMLRDTPDQVAKRLRSEDRRTAFITDESGHYRGIVTLEIAQAAARNGKRQVADIVEESAPTVEQDTPLQELFGLAADSGVPLAVLDERGSLQGILRPAAILDALATRDIPHVTPEESTKEVVGS